MYEMILTALLRN